jgi:hypothetical protein
MDRVKAQRAAPGWWWRSQTSDPEHAAAPEYERVLLSLDPDEWTALNGPTRDDEGRMVTGDPIVDAWERAAWEEALADG